MTDQHERLLKFDDHKLMDVVKNYRQYGYDDTIRSAALSILEERGITAEHLQLTGNLENRDYDEAHTRYRSFRKNSLLTMVFYLGLLLLKILLTVLAKNNDIDPTLASSLMFGAVLVYLFFLVRSFMDQYQFYRSLGEDYGATGAMVYLFVGMPLYIIMLFYFRNQMTDKMAETR